MISLILAFFLAIAFIPIALQNTQAVDFSFFNVNIPQIPLFLLLMGALLLGIFLSTMVSLFDSLDDYFVISNQGRKINRADGAIQDMKKRIYDLELENAKLRGKTETVSIPSHPVVTNPRYSFLDRLKHSF